MIQTLSNQEINNVSGNGSWDAYMGMAIGGFVLAVTGFCMAAFGSRRQVLIRPGAENYLGLITDVPVLGDRASPHWKTYRNIGFTLIGVGVILAVAGVGIIVGETVSGD